MDEDLLLSSDQDSIFCSSPNWEDSNTDYSQGSPMEIQHYQEKITELEKQLQEAQKKIGLLESKVQVKEEKSPKSHSRYWTEEEHNLFLEALSIYGAKDVKSISKHVGTRNTTQVRTHSQKYFLRLERERKKEEERKRLEQSHFKQDQFEKFLAAVRFTSHIKDYDKKIELIHNNHMPETSKETITSWFFIHIKTIEKIQNEEANMAAHSVGVKRRRANSNPVFTTEHPNHPSHPNHPNYSNYSPPNSRFSRASVPTSNLGQSVYRAQPLISNSRQMSPTISTSPQFTYFNPNEYSKPPPNFFSRLEHKPRPCSEPIYQNQNFTMLQNEIENTCSTPPEYHFYQPPQQQNDNMMQDIKPYLPGAPPPSTPAPPPPLFTDNNYNF